MAQAKRVVRLVSEKPVGSEGLLSPRSRVLREAEGRPEDNVARLDSIVARVRGETGTPAASVSIEHDEGSRFLVSGPGDFFDRLSEHREVAVGDEHGRDPFGL
jgi:hypothetical protein